MAQSFVFSWLFHDRNVVDCRIAQRHGIFNASCSEVSRTDGARGKPQRQGHGSQEGATVVTLLLPFSVEEAGLSAPDKLGRYSEAMVELGLRGSDPTLLECSNLLQDFAVLFWRSTRHLGGGRDIEKLELTSEEKFLAWIVARKEVFRARLSGAVEARLSRLHTTEQSTSVDL